MEIKLTSRQAEALIWAIELTKSSYDGWSNADKGAETVADLRDLEAIIKKIYNAPFKAAANA
jgi:hypothetical protein